MKFKKSFKIKGFSVWIMWKEVIHIIHIYWLQIMPFFELSTLSTLLFFELSTLSTLGKVIHIFHLVFHIFVIKRLIKVPIYYRIDKYKTCIILIESVFFALSIVTLFYIYLNTGDIPCIQYKKNGRISLIPSERNISSLIFLSKHGSKHLLSTVLRTMK